MMKAHKKNPQKSKKIHIKKATSDEKTQQCIPLENITMERVLTTKCVNIHFSLRNAHTTSCSSSQQITMPRITGIKQSEYRLKFRCRVSIRFALSLAFKLNCMCSLVLCMYSCLCVNFIYCWHSLQLQTASMPPTQYTGLVFILRF